MGQSRNLSLAIAAALSMSVVTGCSSVGTNHIKTIPTQAAASSPYIVKEEVAFLSATRSRTNNSHDAFNSQQLNFPGDYKTNDLYQAAQQVLGQTNHSRYTYKPSVYRRPSTANHQQVNLPKPTRAVQTQYQPARNIQPQVYRVSQADPLLDNPLPARWKGYKNGTV